MRLSIQTLLLKNALSRLSVIAEKKTSRPFLNNIQITVYQNTIELSATDTEVSSRIVVPANVEKEGSFCVNARNISEILRGFPDTLVELKIEEKENLLKIHCETIDFSIIIFSTSEYPQLVFSNDRECFQFSSSKLLESINKTFHAISTDETRLYLNGLFFQQIENKLRIVSTDAYRLALTEYDFLNSSFEFLENGIIVPKKGVLALKHLMEEYTDGHVSISIDESFLYASINSKEFLSIRLIAREYPKYQAFIPNKVTYSAVLDRDLFLNAVKRIKIMSDEKTHGIRAKLLKNEMQISASHPDLGTASEKIAVDYNGKEMELGLNAKFLVDALSVFQDGDVILELNNEFGPILVKSFSSPEFLGLIMPLKI